MASKDEIERLLRDSFNVEVAIVPELEHPVVIVLDYSPTDSERPISMAFGLRAEPKCWLTLTESEVGKVAGEAPRFHPSYRQFAYRGREFHPYSIQPLDGEVFTSALRFESLCRRMYGHAAWS